MLMGAVTAGARDALLVQACARNTPVEVSVVGRKAKATMKSRLLARFGGQDPSLLIEIPTVRGRPTRLSGAVKLDIVLLHEGQRYGCRVSVKGREVVTLSQSTKVPALVLNYPSVVNRMQRRAHFRVKVPSLEPVTVQCVARDMPAAEAPATSDDRLVRFDTRAVDVSAGGLALLLPRKHSAYGRPGLRLALFFELDSTPLRLMAEIRHVRPVAEGRDLLMGVQFLDPDGSRAGRRGVDVINRYVTRRQRELLKKKSGLE